MVSVIGHADLLVEKIDTTPGKSVSLPFFYALIDSDRPYERAMRKLRELPGVALVSQVSSKELEKSLKQTIESAGLEMAELVRGPQVAGIKVVFSKGLAAEGQNLIRDYLSRLIGESHVTLGAVSTPDANLFKTTSSLGKYRAYFPWVALSILSFVWIWTLSVLFKEWKARAYIIENFQRRSNVLPKMIFSITVPTIIFFLVANLWIAPLEILVVAPLAIFGLVLSLSIWRGGQWEVA